MSKKTIIIHPTQFCEMLGISLSTLYRMEKENKDLPKKLKLSARTRGYLLEDVENYIESLKQN